MSIGEEEEEEEEEEKRKKESHDKHGTPERESIIARRDEIHRRRDGEREGKRRRGTGPGCKGVRGRIDRWRDDGKGEREREERTLAGSPPDS